MMSDDRIKAAKAAKPILESIVKECSDNIELHDIKLNAEMKLANIYRCELFDIWSDSPSIEYGVYCGKIVDIPNCPEYNGGENLLKISFPTGAYIFGNRYDSEYFDEFFMELQKFPAKYIDSINDALYYSPNQARKAYEHYRKTLTKYKEMNSKRKKMWKIKELARQLKELEDEEK